jgi:hypothetical protein
MKKTTGMTAGFGTADITPAPGIQLAGDIGRDRPVEEIRMPLSVRTLVVGSGGKTLCIIQADVIGIAGRIARELAAAVANRLGTEPEAVMLHAPQSHSSPAVGHYWAINESPCIPDDCQWLRGGDDRYIEPFKAGVLASVENALRNRVPVTLHLGRVSDGRAAFNRRFAMRGGTARMYPERLFLQMFPELIGDRTHVKMHPPSGSGDILMCEGVSDPEVGVAVFRAKDESLVGAILHHTCHPCHGYPHRWVHPDWPGAWAEQFSRALGAPGRALTLNGFCGNIHHTNHLDPMQNSTIEEQTGFLMESALRAAGQLAHCTDTTIGWQSQSFQAPWRRLPRETVAQAKAFLQLHPQPKWNDDTRTQTTWDWCYALATVDLSITHRLLKSSPYTVQTLRVGDLAIVGWPGEPFVEYQLEIKADCPAKYCFTAHQVNYGHLSGYQMSAAAIARGSYETWTCNTSALSPKAPAMAMDATRELLANLFPRD